MQKKLLSMVTLLTMAVFSFAQPSSWQQKVKYTIHVQLDVSTNQMKGKQQIRYWNNAPDTLRELYIHLFWNAFQPNSQMDERSRYAGNIILGRDSKGAIVRDWDRRVTDRIQHLQPDEIGRQTVNALYVNGVLQPTEVFGTILKVSLLKPILPKSQVLIDMDFEAQVPLQIRRAGRDNAKNIRFSMSQWYPKIAAYDADGWHLYQYIAREFYAPFGSFDVRITLDKNYLVAGTGTLTNPDAVGFGYGKLQGVPKTSAKTTTWRFVANNVHDFVWAADTAFTMFKRKMSGGKTFYYVYKKTDEENDAKWQALADTIDSAYPYVEKTFGAYQYPNYSFIQGGDGGMEYPMATLINGPSIGTALHEWGHNWFQGVLASNEALHPWMDEGGASYFEERVNGWLKKDSLWFVDSYKSYANLVASGLEEPLSTPGDYFNTNYAYSNASYGKGFVFYQQLAYIIGNKQMDAFLKAYEQTWRFKHPNPSDLIRTAEKVSGLQLQWYKTYWVYSTKTIDYAIAEVMETDNTTTVELKRIGLMPMPLDVFVTYADGSMEMFHIPTDLTFGHKPAENNDYVWRFLPAWDWVKTTYLLPIPKAKQQIQRIEIDPSLRMADINRKNNVWKK